jgi:hypothetical protein
MPLRPIVHVTEDLVLDLNGIYESLGEAADPIRDALVAAIRRMMRGELDQSLIEPYGIQGTTLAYSFYSEYIVTFAIDTHFTKTQPIEEHYFLKNLYRKK